MEYQGDGTKAIFYYTAEDRVDFRELIKVLAEQFRVRIEMKQIGARQEAARRSRMDVSREQEAQADKSGGSAPGMVQALLV